MAPNITCRFCGTDPNAGESRCETVDQARHCAWMGDSDWKRYNKSVDIARARDAIERARLEERERCARIAVEFGAFPGTPLIKDLRMMCGNAIADKIREGGPAISQAQVGGDQ